jgi:transposase
VWEKILGATIHLEIGDVNRFPSAAHLASYAGLVPTVHASGGKSFSGPTSKQANHYLRAFVEAADCILMHRHLYAGQHALQLYDGVKAKKCPGKAAVAIARHLAESTWWILRKREKYRQPHAAVGCWSSNG